MWVKRNAHGRAGSGGTHCESYGYSGAGIPARAHAGGRERKAAADTKAPAATRSKLHLLDGLGHGGAQTSGAHDLVVIGWKALL